MALGSGNDRAVIIALMGTTGVGKSTFIQTCTGDSSIDVGDGIESCTREVHEYLYRLDGKSVILVDMPGFDDSTLPDAQMMDVISTWLADSYESGNKLNGILWLESVEKRRIGNSGIKALELFKVVSGPDFLKNVFCILSLGDNIFDSAQQTRADDMRTKYWKGIIDGGATLGRFDKFDKKNVQSSAAAQSQARNIIRDLFGVQPNVTKLQEEMVDDDLKFTDTGAGKYTNKEFSDMKTKYEKQAAQYQRDAETAKQQNNTIVEKLKETQKELADKNAAMMAERLSMMEQFANDQKRLRDEQADRDARRNNESPAHSLNAPSTGTVGQLFTAVKNNKSAEVTRLIQAGTDVNLGGNDGGTAMMWAARLGFLGIARILLEKGASLKTQNKLGLTALHFAAMCDHAKLVGLICDSVDSSRVLEARDSDGFTPLHIACVHNRKASAEALIDELAKVDAKDKFGFTPLHSTASRGYYGLVKLLLENGANPAARTSNGNTPRRLARRKDHQRVARLIKDYE